MHDPCVNYDNTIQELTTQLLWLSQRYTTMT